jgi:heme A synthase
VKQTYRVLAGVIALGVFVQAAAIAFGWFDAISELDKGLVIDENYEGNAGHALHGMVGMMVMPALGLILLIFSFFAAKVVPGARKWGAMVFGLIVLQVALGIVAFSAPIVGALHGINALLLFASAGRAAMLTRDGRPAGATAEPGAVPSQRTGTSSTGSYSRSE